MERKHLSTRLLSYLLTFAMLLSFAVPVGAAGGGESQISFYAGRQQRGFRISPH